MYISNATQNQGIIFDPYSNSKSAQVSFITPTADTVQISDEAYAMYEAEQNAKTQNDENYTTATVTWPSNTQSQSTNDNFKLPIALDNFAPTGNEENAMNFFMPSVVQDNMPHISELPALGEAGGAMQIQELFNRGNNAWSAYTQAMSEFGLEDSVEFAQSDEFAQWRSTNPELAQELDARSKAIFTQMT